MTHDRAPCPSRGGAADLAEQISTALRLLGRLQRLSDTDLHRRLGLSAAQLLVMKQLASTAHLTITDLSRLTQTAPSSVSEVVKPLVTAGLVAREAGASDRRRLQLRLTARGGQVLADAARGADPVAAALGRAFTPDQKLALSNLLRELIDEMARSGVPPDISSR